MEETQFKCVGFKNYLIRFKLQNLYNLDKQTVSQEVMAELVFDFFKQLVP